MLMSIRIIGEQVAPVYLDEFDKCFAVLAKHGENWFTIGIAESLDLVHSFHALAASVVCRLGDAVDRILFRVVEATHLEDRKAVLACCFAPTWL